MKRFFLSSLVLSFCLATGCRTEPAAGHHHSISLANGTYFGAGTKAIPALAQTASDRATHYCKLFDKPLLHYKIVSPGHARGRVTIESDYPSKLFREYWADPALNKLSLDEFAGRVVRITLSAELHPGDDSQRFYWINPQIQDIVRPNKHNEEQLQAFRKRHQKDNVLLVVFDAAGASHLSCYGYPRKTTPQVDALASEGVVFENAFAQAPFTTASTATLLTGFHPLVHRVGMQLDLLDGSYRTLAEFFSHMGYETALFSGNPYASPMVGFGQGFRKVWIHQASTPSRAGDLVTQAASWLKQSHPEPFFAYLHFREPHAPYDPPTQFSKVFADDPFWLSPYAALSKRWKNAINAYDANLAYADSALQKLIEMLKSLRLFNRTIIVISADHGEAFLEHHGFHGHNRHVYDEFIRIPLLIRPPNEPASAGLRRKEPVGPIDLFATFCDLFGFNGKFVSGSGESLLPYLSRSEGFSDRMMISLCRPPSIVYSIRSADFKFISFLKESTPEEFYRLSTDPFERNNVIRDYPILSSYYRSELQRRIEQLRKEGEKMPRPPKMEQPMDEETREQLRALGYVDH